MRLLCVSFFQITWLLILVTFVVIPQFIILAMRRVHIYNKIKRKLIKQGLPRKQAKAHARKFKDILVQYGSIKGVYKTYRIIRKDKKEDELNEDVSVNNTNNQATISLS
jgi:hypothetical protein